MEIEAGVYYLHEFAVLFDEPRAQDFVPVDDRLKGSLDRRSIESRFEFPTQGDVENRTSSTERMDEPASLL
jgi:hypothetical protein